MRPLRLVTYNVRYFGHGTRGLASTRGAMDRVATALAKLSPIADLICLQEVETTSLRSNLAHPSPNGETQLQRFMASLHAALVQANKQDSYEAYYFPAHLYGTTKAPLYTTGLAVIAHRSFHVSRHNAGEPFDITCRRIHPVRRLKQTRICAHLRVVHESGRNFDVFNTHLSLPSTLSRAFWFEPHRMGWGANQVEEAANVARFVRAHADEEGRYVVVGDFNALPGSPTYRALLESGLEDAFARVSGKDEQSLRAWPTAGFMNLRMHLDHVFTGQGLKWHGFDDSHRFADRSGAFDGLSDHVPLIGTFSFNV